MKEEGRERRHSLCAHEKIGMGGLTKTEVLCVEPINVNDDKPVSTANLQVAGKPVVKRQVFAAAADH